MATFKQMEGTYLSGILTAKGWRDDAAAKGDKDAAAMYDRIFMDAVERYDRLKAEAEKEEKKESQKSQK